LLKSRFHAFIAELFEDFGSIEVRPMFGFEALFRGGTIFGVVAEERIYLKCDTQSRIKFVEAGTLPFRYHSRDGNEIVTSYHELPTRLYDEPGEACEWARAAYEAALRSANTARKTRSRLTKEKPPPPVRRRRT
jgi:DNA transformation protein and related proteins